MSMSTFSASKSSGGVSRPLTIAENESGQILEIFDNVSF